MHTDFLFHTEKTSQKGGNLPYVRLSKLDVQLSNHSGFEVFAREAR